MGSFRGLFWIIQGVRLGVNGLDGGEGMKEDLSALKTDTSIETAKLGHKDRTLSLVSN